MNVIINQLTDRDLGVLRALEESGAPVDDAHLASVARISVSSAQEAGRKLVGLGLVRQIQGDGGEELFELLPEKVEEQIAAVGRAGVEV